MRVQQGRREAANSTRALRSPISHQAAPSEQEPARASWRPPAMFGLKKCFAMALFQLRYLFIGHASPEVLPSDAC